MLRTPKLTRYIRSENVLFIVVEEYDLLYSVLYCLLACKLAGTCTLQEDPHLPPFVMAQMEPSLHAWEQAQLSQNRSGISRIKVVFHNSVLHVPVTSTVILCTLKDDVHILP